MSPPEAFQNYRVDGTSILASDLRVVVAATAVEDAGASVSLAGGSKLFVTLAGIKYTVVAVWPLMSGSLAAAYELQLRL